MGDFNSHNVMWGYTENNEDGEKVERDNMSLIYNAKLPPSFNSGRWRKGYNPDNIFVSHNIRNISIKSILKAIPKTQHRPIQCQINAIIVPRMVPFRRRFNFKRLNGQKSRNIWILKYKLYNQHLPITVNLLI